MSAHVHPAVAAVREFERDSDEIERRCNAIASQLLAGEFNERDFDREAALILGADYDPRECVAEYTDRCDCPVCDGGVWPCVNECGRLQTRGQDRRCPGCAHAFIGSDLS